METGFDRRLSPQSGCEESGLTDPASTQDFDQQDDLGPLAPFRAIPQIDLALGLSRVGGFPELYEEVAVLFHRSTLTDIGLLRSCLEEANFPLFCTLVHRVKSSLSSIGAEELSRAALELEGKSRLPDPDYCRAHFPLFEQETLALLTALDAILGPPWDPSQDEEGADPKEKLKSIQKAINLFEFDVARSKLEALRQGPLEAPLTAFVEELYGDMLDFDFSAADEKITRLLEG